MELRHPWSSRLPQLRSRMASCLRCCLRASLRSRFTNSRGFAGERKQNSISTRVLWLCHGSGMHWCTNFPHLDQLCNFIPDYLRQETILYHLLLRVSCYQTSNRGFVQQGRTDEQSVLSFQVA